jgi:hypothetical protein
VRQYVVNFKNETLFVYYHISYHVEINFANTVPEGAQRILKPQKIKVEVVPFDQMETCIMEQSARRQASGSHSFLTDFSTLWIVLRVINDDRTFKPLYTQLHTLTSLWFDVYNIKRKRNSAQERHIQ